MEGGRVGGGKKEGRRRERRGEGEGGTITRQFCLTRKRI